MLNRFCCSSTARSGRRVGSRSGTKQPSTKKSRASTPCRRSSSCWKQRQVALHGVVVLAQGDEGRVAGRESRLDAPQEVALDVLIDAQGAQDLVDRQVRQEALCDHQLPLGLTVGILSEAPQRAEQPGGELIDAQHNGLGLVVHNGAQQAALLGKGNGGGDIGQNLLSPFGPAAELPARRGRSRSCGIDLPMKYDMT